MDISSERMLTRKDILDAFTRCKLFQVYSQEEIARIMPLVDPEPCFADKGTVVVHIGDPARRAGIVVSGRLTEHRPGCGSEPHCFGRYNAGTMFGLEAFFSGPKTSPVELTAETDCVLLWIDIQPLLNDLRYGSRFKDVLLEKLSNRWVCSTLKLDAVLGKSLRERIMTFFWGMRGKFGSDTFQIKLTQGELAETLGSNRSALSRELNRMQREGILELLPNRGYHIMKWEMTPQNPRPQSYNTDEVNRGT